jgi:uncharacterized DUF497 family protein
MRAAIREPKRSVQVAAESVLKDTYDVCILMLVADELVFDWDEANVAHIARHNVTPEEVEQVFANDPMDLRVDIVDGEERYASVGHTNGPRVLVLAWTMRADATRSVTAFDASERLAKRYLVERGF